MWSVIIERFDSAGNSLRDVRANFNDYDAAIKAFKSMRAEFADDPLKVVTMVVEEQVELNFELDPALEAQEAQRKHEAEEQRIEELCEKYEGHGMCTNLTPVGDEYDRNTGQCHVCDEWGIVHCDFGRAGSRALCEKHLIAAADDRLQTFINVYGMSRILGGPEEGGWWYTAGEPLASFPVCDCMTDDQLEEMRSMIMANIMHVTSPLPWGDRYEKVGTIVELRPGRYFPLEKPHYE